MSGSFCGNPVQGLVSKALVVQHYAEKDEEVTVSHTFYVDEMK